MAAVPGLFEVVVQLTGGAGSGPFLNVWHIGTTGAGLTSEVVTICTKISDFYNTNKSIFASGISITAPVKVVDYRTDPPILVGVAPVTVASLGSGQAPPQNSMVMSMASLIAARKGRGRKYFGPLTNNVISGTNGDIQTANVTTMQTAATTLLSAVAAAAGSWALAIPNRDPDTKELVGWTPVSGLIVRSHVFTQRRRGF